ncbi:MAG: Tim44 domain-containing protein [Micavibrio aeruginosavorus]|uniref:Tim44 domain-containing protein n=1 Tax=Micavibrio aeruginosavorus TaxID=349221 RepID=A0A2W4ZLY3_9BACT|nr:MAG: Tim44 domain-containing protein [Micavibrio aeruginosavorus]
MQADIILYAVIAAGLVFWLRSILGTKHGDERERPNPFTAQPQENPVAAGTADGVSLPLPESAKPALPRNVSLSGANTEYGLSEIAKADPQFDLNRFAGGAQDAFAMIVEAFAAGDRDTLKDLLAPQVYSAFDQAIAARAAAGETMSTEIHAVRKMEILEARVEARTAYLTIRFIADETCVIRDANGTILSGDPDRITEMNDIWVFSRPVGSRDPKWYLHETRDGDVSEEHKTPVPGTTLDA